MINDPNQNQNELQHVNNQCTKFQAHMIRHKNFTNHLNSTLNKSPIMTNQQRKSQTNWKWIQKFYKNSQENLTSRRINMQKIRLIEVHMAW